MSKSLIFTLGTAFGLAIGVVVAICGARKVVAEARADASQQPAAAPEPKCIRERRLHVYGTYDSMGYAVGRNTLPVDLTVAECLEWGSK